MDTTKDVILNWELEYEIGGRTIIVRPKSYIYLGNGLDGLYVDSIIRKDGILYVFGWYTSLYDLDKCRVVVDGDKSADALNGYGWNEPRNLSHVMAALESDTSISDYYNVDVRVFDYHPNTHDENIKSMYESINNIH